MAEGQSEQILIEMLATNEEVLAQLYTTYANLFPKKQLFWLELADAEIEHARMIREIDADAIQPNDAARSGSIIDLVQISLDYIAEKQDQADHGKVSMQEAAGIALSIETGILERGTFKLVRTDASAINRLFTSLADDTHRHTEKIRKELGKKRWLFF